jgi:hypothetical protein
MFIFGEGCNAFGIQVVSYVIQTVTWKDSDPSVLRIHDFVNQCPAARLVAGGSTKSISCDQNHAAMNSPIVETKQINLVNLQQVVRLAFTW